MKSLIALVMVPKVACSQSTNASARIGERELEPLGEPLLPQHLPPDHDGEHDRTDGDQRQLPTTEHVVSDVRRRGPATLPHAPRRGDAVEHDRHDDDRDAPIERGADAQPLQTVQHRLTQTTRADERSDHDDAERHHDRLVDTEHDRRLRQRDLDQAQSLSIGRTERVRDLERRLGDRTDPKRRQTDRGRDRERQGRQQRWRLPDAEQQHERQQVRVGRDRLHRVQDRAQHPLHPWPATGPDPERDPDRQRQDDSHDHQRQRLDRRVPDSQETETETPADASTAIFHPATRPEIAPAVTTNPSHVMRSSSRIMLSTIHVAKSPIGFRK